MAKVQIKPRPVCPQFQCSFQYAILPTYHTNTFGCRVNSDACHQCICFSLAKQIERKGNNLFPSTSFPGKIPLLCQFCQWRKEHSLLFLAHNTTAATFPEEEKPEYGRTERHLRSLLRSYPCSFTTVYHLCGETCFGKHCSSNSLKATVPGLHTAVGGHLWSVDSEG